MRTSSGVTSGSGRVRMSVGVSSIRRRAVGVLVGAVLAAGAVGIGGAGGIAMAKPPVFTEKGYVDALAEA
ncbi:MAG: hypothetical protein MUE97_06835, partial [Phycisphaerales bacterium]|nr:hypothetical protein [Phycisphaerales bacterium]